MQDRAHNQHRMMHVVVDLSVVGALCIIVAILGALIILRPGLLPVT